MYDDFLARILEPDIFLPSQFYGTGGLSRKLEGEKRLMIDAGHGAHHGVVVVAHCDQVGHRVGMQVVVPDRLDW